jgi:DNA primase
MASLSKVAQEYIERRGWSEQDYKPLGVYSIGDFVYFPLRDYNDKSIGVISRNIRYKNYNIEYHKSSFGYFLWRGVDSDRVLFLVEGVFDVGWLLQSGLHAAAYINNTLLGAQLRIISRFYEKVIIIPDNDPEGQYGAGLAVKRLQSMGVPFVREFKLEGYKDVCETFEKNRQTAKNLLQILKSMEKAWIEPLPEIEPDAAKE